MTKVLEPIKYDFLFVIGVHPPEGDNSGVDVAEYFFSNEKDALAALDILDTEVTIFEELGYELHDGGNLEYYCSKIHTSAIKEFYISKLGISDMVSIRDYDEIERRAGEEFKMSTKEYLKHKGNIFSKALDFPCE